ncbi:hypothetical protein E2986_12837 [Frieseomelitta varia]|uniref:Secreted protein n=1 Tax=Frieseomelitta varia TaxID=561572 RepID=A0A833VS58_9HYME|nr:hypothetical protein E2986_12837 [Frieseomelitta varia]
MRPHFCQILTVLILRKLKMCLTTNSTRGDWDKFMHMKTLFYNIFHSVTICSKSVSVHIYYVRNKEDHAFK